MTAVDIFKKISMHQISGVMLHKNMMRYYDFLGLHCMKRAHEYHMFKELAENDGIERYTINHLNHVIIDGHIPPPFIVPESWENVDRLTVKNDSRRKYLMEGMTKWHEWEKTTKAAYQAFYKELCEMGEVAAARKVLKLVKGVDKELKDVERLYIKMNEVEWDLKSIIGFADKMHDHYANKTKHIGIKIC